MYFTLTDLHPHQPERGTGYQTACSAPPLAALGVTELQEPGRSQATGFNNP